MSENLVIERVSRVEWDELAANFRDLSYRQCSRYAEEAAKRVGAVSELNRIMTKDQQLIGLAEIRIRNAPMTPWGIAYANYAPVIMKGECFSECDFGRCLDALCQEYVERRGLVLRVVPPPNGGLFQSIQASCLEARGFRPCLTEPRKTFLLDLSRSLEEIRRNLNPKWRRSLMRAERLGIKITRSVELKDFAIFNDLFLECTKRKRFMPEQDVQFFKHVQSRAPSDQKMVLHLAWDHDELVAGHLGSYLGNTAVYLLGASNLRGRDLHASFLLQWAAIGYARIGGNAFYDVGGVDEQGNPGVYRFKKRLNGRPLTELAPYELARDPVSRGVIRLGAAARSALTKGLSRISRRIRSF
jgi:Acetyltransferase (GNAT) domain